MKKILSILAVLSMTLALFAGCGSPAPEASKSDTAPVSGAPGKVLKVANVVNGNLGDKSFFDSCEAGLKQLADEGKITYKTLELGPTDADQPRWNSTMEELSADGSYDIIICGGWQMNEILARVAPDYPDQNYISYDSEVTAPNVASVLFKQNDLGYLAGTAAALVTTSGMEKTNADKVIGFVGGEDDPTVNDFLIGYIEGAQAVASGIKIDAQYVGNYYDTGKGKELANVMLDNKCDIVWGVAGVAGNGAAEAAAEKNAWFIGVDSDQEATFSENQPKLAAATLFSGLKNCGDGLAYIINKELEGTAPWGQTFNLGIAEGGVALTSGGNYVSLPDNIKTALDEVTAKVSDGTIQVNTAFDEKMDVKALREAVRP